MTFHISRTHTTPLWVRSCVSTAIGSRGGATCGASACDSRVGVYPGVGPNCSSELRPSPREIGRSAHCRLQYRGRTMWRSALRPQRCLISICISGSAPRSSSLVLPAGPGRVSGLQPLVRFSASNAGTSARSPLTFRTSKRETTKHAQVEQVAVVNPTAGSRPRAGSCGEDRV